MGMRASPAQEPSVVVIEHVQSPRPPRTAGTQQPSTLACASSRHPHRRCRDADHSAGRVSIYPDGGDG
jgi:hypothetical protein